MYSGVDQRKHQSSASLAFMRGIHQWPVNSPHRWPVTRKRFPFDDVIMIFHNAIHQWVQISNFLIYFRVITQHWVDDLVSSEIILKDIDKSSATKKQSIQTVCIHLFHDLTLNNVRWLILLISRRLMMTWLNGNIFCVTGPLCGESNRSPVDSPHRGQWRGALVVFLSAPEQTVE